MGLADSFNRTAAKLCRLPQNADILGRIGFNRYHVVFKTLPFVVLAVLVRLILSLSLGWQPGEGLFGADTVTPFSTAAMFVIAIILGGVLEDYKEAERIPAYLSNGVDGWSNRIQIAATATRGQPLGKRVDSRTMHEELLHYTGLLLCYFAGLVSEQEILAANSATFQYVVSCLGPTEEVHGVYQFELAGSADSMRDNLSRMGVIRRTNYLPSGSDLLRVLTLMTVVLTSLTTYDTGASDSLAPGRLAQESGTYLQVATYVFLFVYILFLIDDLEDPFEYSPDALLPSPNKSTPGAWGRTSMRISGSADVDAFPLLELYSRLGGLAGRQDVAGQGAGGWMAELMGRTSEGGHHDAGKSPDDPAAATLVDGGMHVTRPSRAWPAVAQRLVQPSVLRKRAEFLGQLSIALCSLNEHGPHGLDQPKSSASRGSYGSGGWFGVGVGAGKAGGAPDRKERMMMAAHAQAAMARPYEVVSPLPALKA